MGILPNGKYIIEAYVTPQPPAGVDHIDHSTVTPVITDGHKRVWSIQEAGDGNYNIILEEKWYSTYEGDQVVIITGVCPDTTWTIQKAGDVVYTIGLSDTGKVWTATDVEHKSPVILQYRNLRSMYQLWKFVRKD